MSTTEYLDSVATITTKLAADSLAALPQGVSPTRLQVQAVEGLRSAALTDIRSLDPTDEVGPEHLALVTALGRLVDAGRSFLDRASGLDQAAFLDALDSSADLNSLAADVHAACLAMERRASDLGHPISMGC
jgi:hypothetical protein